MIIECPACTTRYDIKARIPPEGRTVRCAKCGHIWRAKPLPEEEPASVPEPAAGAAGFPGLQHGEALQEATEERYEDAPREEAGEEVAGGAESGDGDHGTDSPFESPEETHEDRNYFAGAEEFSPGPAEDERPELDEETSGVARDLQTLLPDWGSETTSRDDEETKVSWFSSFRRRKNAKSGDQDLRDAQASGKSAANPIPFPKPTAGEELTRPQSGDDLRTLEEAREAVRDVFASLEAKSSSGPVLSFQAVSRDTAGSANRAASLEPQSIFAPWPSKDQSPAVPSAASDGHGTGTPRWEEDIPTGLDAAGNVTLPKWAESAASPEGAEPVAESHPWFRAWRERQPDDTSDPDSQLRNALRAHFPEQPAPTEVPQTPDPDLDTAGEVIQQSIIERFAASWKRPETPPQQQTPQPEAESGDALDAGENGAVFDPRLYREIEETQEQASNPKRREGRGGLALAAAWGLFICIASGLIVGLFAFRDIAAGAIPGLATLYSSAGFPADVQPLAIESVEYEWISEDFKPVLVIRGTVYNSGVQPLKVPEFTVTVKDNDPALDQEYPAELHLEDNEIAPGQRKDFQIELQSPSPSITAVELELRRVH